MEEVTRELERIEPDVSQGSEAIIRSIMTLSDPYDLILLSAPTIVRNALGSTEKDIQVGYLQRVKKNAVMDLGKILSYISAYTNRIGKEEQNVVIYSYSSMKPPIHSRYLKNVTDKKNMVNNMYDVLSTVLLKEKMSFQFLKYTKVHVPGPFVRNILPVIKKLSPKYPKIRVLLLANLSIHYHLASQVEHLTLLRSFTGDLLHATPKSLGEIVFNKQKKKNWKIPFNPYTHAVLGDGEQIVPLFKGKRKEELISLGNKNKWDIMPLANIRKDILSFGGVSVTYLDEFKF